MKHMRSASVYSVANKLIRKIKDNPAYGLFTAFLISIFFLKGGFASTVAVACFAASWILIAREARGSELPIPLIAPIVLAFLIASGLRLLLPPNGAADTVPGSGVSHAILVAGLYGLILFVQLRLRFSRILWLISAAALACIVVTLVGAPQIGDRLLLVGRTNNPILAAGAIATGLIATITLLAYYTDIRRAPLKAILLALMIFGILTGLYLTGSRGPLLALVFALGLTPLVIFTGSRTLLFICAFGAYALVTAGVLLASPIRHLLCPEIELACRDPSRFDVWMQSLDTIALHPLWGVGYAFRFEGTVPHAHNTYLGMALHYGIPLAIFFVCVMAVALFRASELESKEEKFFIVAMLIFANGFMASDLSEPLRFFNTHYLFLWLPIFLAMIRPRVLQNKSPRSNATA
jgi:O-antigen ligase